MCNPLVSIVTASYNYAHYLPECIASVKAQTFKDYEHIVVNSGSSDNTSEVAQALGVDLLVDLKDQARGSGYNRNQGFAKARGKYLLNLDADDSIEPTFLERVVELARPSTIVATGISRSGLSNTKTLPEVPCTYKDLWFRNRLFCCSLMPKDHFYNVGGFDTALDGNGGCEDYELWCSLFRDGCTASLVPEYLFNYRWHRKYEDYTPVEQQVFAINYIQTKHREALVQ